MRRLAWLLLLAGCVPPRPEPGFPRAMIVPQPEDQLSFQVDGREWLRYHYGAQTPKPYFYPVMGPAGAPVTRLTHPHDPVTHAHHLSLWIGHQNVAGSNFWEHMKSAARIVHDRIVKIEDGDRATLTLTAKWLDGDKKPLLLDERVWTLTPRYETLGSNGFGEYTLDLKLTLTPVAPTVTIGKSNFGLVAVRVAKMMGTLDGGGCITNSEGKVNEKELMPHRRARWCDYSGQAAPGRVNGVTLFGHPSNPNHPSYFHVRGDGWMGSSFSFENDVVVAREKPLVLRYRFLVHAGPADPAMLDAEDHRFAE
ncbi:MAG TPA: PmoA family protein [Planctomycetota bacterium]|nr:PmoA family protein [Planctomycetota bacterium]